MRRSMLRMGLVVSLTLGWLLVVAVGLAARSVVGAAANFTSTGESTATTTAPPFTITLESIVTGLASPVGIVNAGDGSNRLFVLEQSGYVRVIKNGVLLSTPYLTLTGEVVCCGEQGLLGIAFDPDFASNGTFYLNYTTSASGYTGDTVIARYHVANPSADVADVLAATPVITITQPEPNHNGGNLLFGPDGYLYIGMGDGGGENDPHGPTGNGQNPAVLLGKMLRLNVRGVPTYTIPPGNPFTQTADYLPEIWALGLRNPWRFSFDRATGDLYIGDVGQNCWEEIDYQPASSHGGQNYGWRLEEGFRLFDPNDPFNCNEPISTLITTTKPITAYNHNFGSAVMGGYVYRGQDFPWLNGIYFYGDYGSGRIWAAEQTSPGVWWTEQKFVAPFHISTFGEDEHGELYVADYSGGGIYRLTSASPIDFAASTKQVSTASASPGEVLSYTIALRNTGQPFSSTVRMTDVVPAGLAYVPGSLSATDGMVDGTSAPTLKWKGVMSATSIVTITYRASVTGSANQTIVNTALIDPAINPVLSRSASVLVVTQDLSTSFKRVSKANVRTGERVTYTVVLHNQGSILASPVRLTDVVPAGLGYVSGSFTATGGIPDEAGAPTLIWSGILSPTPIVTLTYAVTASTSVTQAITNNAVIAPGYTAPFTRSATIVINGWITYLPVVSKN